MTHKIYEDARKKINGILSELLLEHCLTANEIAYEVTMVREELVTFKIHEKLRGLIWNQYVSVASGRNEIEFVQEPDDKWSLTIRAGGVESHFFARLLELVLRKEAEEKKEYVCDNKEVIKESIDEIIQDIDNKNKYQVRVWYKKGTYFALIGINGVRIILKNNENECPGSLRVIINKELPGLIKSLMRNKKKKR